MADNSQSAATLAKKFTSILLSTFTGGKRLTTSKAGGPNAGIAAALIQRARLRGVIPSGRLPFAVDPANLDPIFIGEHEFRFLTTLIAATTYTQVKRGAGAATSLARLVDAINGTTNANVVQATTPFAEEIVADAVAADVLRVRLADKRGGDPIPGISDSMALTATITAGAAAWDRTDLNASGKELADQDMAWVEIEITQAMIDAGAAIPLELPFTPVALLSNMEGAATISDDAILVAMSDGQNGFWVDGDKFKCLAIG